MKTFPMRSLFAPLKVLMETLGGICVGLGWLFHLLLRLAVEEDDDELLEVAPVDLVLEVRLYTTVSSGLVLPISLGIVLCVYTDNILRSVMMMG